MSAAAPFGFSLAKRPPSHNEYYVAADDTSPYAVGDPVSTTGNFFRGLLPDSRVTHGLPHVSRTASGGRVKGVIMGIIPGPGGAEGTSLPAVKSRPYVILVDDSPLATFSIQADNILPIASGGMYANFTAANPTGSVSGYKLDATSLNTSTGDLLIHKLEQNTGANSIAVVSFVLREDAQIQTPVSGDGFLEAPAGYAASDALVSVVCIGDSRTYAAEYVWKNVTWTDAQGLPLSVGFCTGTGIAVDSVGGGTLEYRASDKNVRWTAPSDTAGPWMPVYAGWLLLASGSASMGVRIGWRSIKNLPGTDKTVVVSVTGTARYNWGSASPMLRAFSIMRWPVAYPIWAGLGGNTIGQVDEQLPWLQTQADTYGVDLIHIGTNDISAAAAPSKIIPLLRKIYQTRASLGRRIVGIGEPARWGATVNAPLSVAQIALTDEINKFHKTACATFGGIYVDLMSVTADPAYTDRRPAPGIMADQVHYSDLGAQIAGQAIADALAAVIPKGTPRAEGSANNKWGSYAYMAGASGTLGTGCTGVAPTSWTTTRVIGADLTAAISVAARTDGIAGNWMVVDLQAAAGAQLLQIEAPNFSLATLGLVVGDVIFAEIEMQVSGATGGLVEVDYFVNHSGATPASSIRALVVGSASTSRQADESAIRRTPQAPIPASATGLRPFIWIRTSGACSARIKLGATGLVKV